MRGLPVINREGMKIGTAAQGKAMEVRAACISGVGWEIKYCASQKKIVLPICSRAEKSPYAIGRTGDL